jgi:hypothetical protein
MAGKTPRVIAAQEALDVAIKEFVTAADEMDLADSIRLGRVEDAEAIQKLQTALITHWGVAFSRTYWERDEDDPEDTTEYPVTKVGCGVRDDTSPYWVVGGLLRRAATVVEDD